MDTVNTKLDYIELLISMQDTEFSGNSDIRRDHDKTYHIWNLIREKRNRIVKILHEVYFISCSNNNTTGIITLIVS